MKTTSAMRNERAHAWLDDLPQGWTSIRLKYISTINDETLPETTSPDHEILYVDIGNVDAVNGIKKKESLLFETAPSRARRIVRNGDTIVSTVRTYLRAIATIHNPEDNLVVSTGFAVIRPRGIDPNYLAYCLRSSHFVESVVSGSTGVSYPATNPTEVSCIKLPLPDSTQEQSKIARFLDEEIEKIDSVIEIKRQLVEKLKEERQALITRAVTRGMPPKVTDARAQGQNPKLKDSGVDWLGPIASHWNVMRLRFLLSERLQYGANEAAELDDTDLPRFVRITDVDEDGSLRPETFRSLPMEIAKPYLLKQGDILFARSGATSGKTFLYENEWGTCAYAGYLIRARLNQEKINPKFLRYFTASENYWQWVSLAFIQATIQNISAEKYADLWVPIPPVEEQAQIVNYLKERTSKLNQLIEKAREAIDRLTEYRQALITSAVTGKIDVRHWKRTPEAA